MSGLVDWIGAGVMIGLTREGPKHGPAHVMRKAADPMRTPSRVRLARAGGGGPGVAVADPEGAGTIGWAAAARRLARAIAMLIQITRPSAINDGLINSTAMTVPLMAWPFGSISA